MFVRKHMCSENGNSRIFSMECSLGCSMCVCNCVRVCRGVGDECRLYSHTSR